MNKLLAASLLFMACYALTAQDQPDLEKLRPKRFIDKVEIIAGANLIMPNADGWASFINNTSSGTTYQIQNKFGFLAGIGLSHSVSKKFELHGRFFWEEKGYKEEYVTISGSNTNKSSSDRKDNYITFSITGGLGINKTNALKLFFGPYLSSIISSEEDSEYFQNGKVTGSARVNTIDGATKYNFGLLIGTGYSFNLNSSKEIEIRLQAGYGINDVVNANKYIVRCNNVALLIALKIAR